MTLRGEIGGGGQRQPERQRVGGADGRHGAGRGHFHAALLFGGAAAGQRRVVELLPGYRPQSMGIYGIYTSRRQMPATLRTMLDFLVEWFASDPQWQATLR